MTNVLTDPRVAAYRMQEAAYPAEAPFHPSERWPEYAWPPISGSRNCVYEAVRGALHLLEMDATNYGRADWNPLGELVRPGDSVVVKPNLISHSHKYQPSEWQSVITHGSVVRAVVDYVLIALRGDGEVWIADGPQLDADWDLIIQRTGLQHVVDYYAQVSPVPVRLLDLRDLWTDVRDDVRYGSRVLPGDPRGSTVVRLGEASSLRGPGFDDARYYGADYDQDETNFHHADGRHEYRVSRTVMGADVLINVPKMKTHKKCGVTLAAKNLVGVNTGRNWLPHYRQGGPSAGGDQFPGDSAKARVEIAGIRWFQRATLSTPLIAPLFKMAKRLARPLFGHTRDTVRSGNWSGNDTVWRMVHDINKCVLYFDANGSLRPEPRRYFAVVDGVIAGHRNGPEAPDPYPAGTIVAGSNPIALDYATTILMGFDPSRFPILREGFGGSWLPLTRFGQEDVVVSSNDPSWVGSAIRISRAECHHFDPHFGWDEDLGVQTTRNGRDGARV